MFLDLSKSATFYNILVFYFSLQLVVKGIRKVVKIGLSKNWCSLIWIKNKIIDVKVVLKW